MAPIPPPPGSPDLGVAWHHGDPFREQRLLESGAAIVDLSHRGVVEVSGPDRLKWLHDLTTQHVAELAPGESALTLILDRNGRVEHEIHLTDDGRTSWLSVEPGQAPALTEYLHSMRFLLRVEVADASERFAVVGSGTAAAREGAPTWIVPPEYRGEPCDRGGDAAKYVPRRPRPLRRSEFLVPREELSSVITQAPALAGIWAWEALRVGAGVPRFGLDTDSRTIPHEVGWIGAAVHLAKGCYRGQETVARVHNLGRPPRRLVLLHLDGSSGSGVATGDVVVADQGPIGSVGSVAEHYELGPIALAVVKRSVPTNVELAVLPTRTDSADPGRDRIAASQEIIVTA